MKKSGKKLAGDRIIDPPMLEFGYTDEAFSKLVALYVQIFGEEPVGSGNNPSRTFAIRESLHYVDPMTLDDISEHSDKDSIFVRDNKNKRWKLV